MQVRFALIVATLGVALAASTPAAAHISKKSNAQKAIAFLEMVFNQKKVKEGFDKYVGDKYIQHNPIAADGKEAAVEVLGKACRRCRAGPTKSSTPTSTATTPSSIRTCA